MVFRVTKQNLGTLCRSYDVSSTTLRKRLEIVPDAAAFRDHFGKDGAIGTQSINRALLISISTTK